MDVVGPALVVMGREVDEARCRVDRLHIDYRPFSARELAYVTAFSVVLMQMVPAIARGLPEEAALRQQLAARAAAHHLVLDAQERLDLFFEHQARFSGRGVGAIDAGPAQVAGELDEVDGSTVRTPADQQQQAIIDGDVDLHQPAGHDIDHVRGGRGQALARADHVGVLDLVRALTPAQADPRSRAASVEARNKQLEAGR